MKLFEERLDLSVIDLCILSEPGGIDRAADELFGRAIQSFAEMAVQPLVASTVQKKPNISAYLLTQEYATRYLLGAQPEELRSIRNYVRAKLENYATLKRCC